MVFFRAKIVSPIRTIDGKSRENVDVFLSDNCRYFNDADHFKDNKVNR